MNMFFTQRIIRAQHPHIGWSKPASAFFLVCYGLIVLTLVALIVATLQSFFTLSHNTRRIDRDIELYGGTWNAFISFLPILLVGLSTLLRFVKRNQGSAIDKFGSGYFRVKIWTLLIGASLLCLGASFRAGTNFLRPTPLSAAEPWYFSKICFYLFNFTIEILVVYGYAAARIDKRFFIPNKARGPYSYGGGFTFAGEPGNEKRTLGHRDSQRNLTSASRTSWGGQSRSSSRRGEGRVSWGGVSRETFEPAVGEDGEMVIPYFGADEEYFPGITGADQEMGFDAKRGTWQLRPISG
ncbi:hypothetical protein LTR28_003043, partial [Elasticomyces elasticus]